MLFIYTFSILYQYKFISIYTYDNVLYNVLVYNFRDCIKNIYYDLNMKYEMLFHHFILMSSIVFTFFKNEKYIYTYYLSLNFFIELTNPPLNLCHCLYRLNIKNNIVFKISSYITFILFFY